MNLLGMSAHVIELTQRSWFLSFFNFQDHLSGRERYLSTGIWLEIKQHVINVPRRNAFLHNFVLIISLFHDMTVQTDFKLSFSLTLQRYSFAYRLINSVNVLRILRQHKHTPLECMRRSYPTIGLLEVIVDTPESLQRKIPHKAARNAWRQRTFLDFSLKYCTPHERDDRRSDGFVEGGRQHFEQRFP